MFKVGLLAVGTLLGIFSVWSAELLIQPPVLCEATAVFGLGLFTGAMAGVLLMFIFSMQVVGCYLRLMPVTSQIKAKKTMLVTEPSEAELRQAAGIKDEEVLPTFDEPPYAQPVEEEDYPVEDAWLHDPDFWKKNQDH